MIDSVFTKEELIALTKGECNPLHSGMSTALQIAEGMPALLERNNYPETSWVEDLRPCLVIMPAALHHDRLVDRE